MPKPLSPEQLSELQANGVVVPGYEAPESTMPAGLVQRALGRTGLPNSAAIDQMGPNLADDSSIEAIGSESFREQLLKTYNTTVQIMDLVGLGESVPAPQDSELQANIAEMSETFSLYESLGLEPDVVLTPTGRSLVFWSSVFYKAQNSPLNPTQAGTNDKILLNGGLHVSDEVEETWVSLTKRGPQDVDKYWKLEVISGKNKPEIMNVTSYGYTDKGNENASPALNELLRKLSLPEVPERTGRKSQRSALTQPNLHPYIDTYAMNQLTRIIQGKDPIDTNTWSWLRGAIDSGNVPAGYWNPVDGQVDLDRDYTGSFDGSLGVRPSASAS